MRHKFRPGDYLIIDDMSGEELWASEAGYDWNGAIRRSDDMDGEHPSYYAQNYPSEHYPEMVNAPALVTAYSSAVPTFVGLTTVTAQPGPAPNRFLD